MEEPTRTGRKKVLGSVTTRAASYIKQEPTRTGRRKVLGSSMMRTDSYIKQEPIRMVIRYLTKPF